MVTLRTKYQKSTPEYQLLLLVMTLPPEELGNAIANLLDGEPLGHGGERILFDVLGDSAVQIINNINKGDIDAS